MQPSWKLAPLRRAVAASLLVLIPWPPSNAQDISSPGSLVAVVTARFAVWDANHDGILGTNELDDAVADARITGQDAAAIAALKRASRSSKTKCPPLTLPKVSGLATNPPAAGQPDLARLFREGLSRITNATCRDLFATGLPRLETIHQGKLGNCFCLAPLGAMVARDPAQVAGLFSRQEDGTYRVKLGQRTVIVAPPTDAELAMTASNERDGIWVNLFEKAVGQARNEDKPPERRVGSPIDALAGGGSASTVLAYITGHGFTRFSFKFAKDPSVSAAEREIAIKELRGQLTLAVREQRLMTCGTLKTTTPGLTANHAYAILGYAPGTDAVRLWNPHGGNFTPKGKPGLEKGYPQKDGILEVPLTEFVQQFNRMSFETAPTERK